jgi:capsule polysaccharide export protein KpsE/RkpR
MAEYDIHTTVEAPTYDLVELASHALALGRFWPILAGALLAGGAVGYSASYAITPTFLSTTLFIPPLQQQNGASSALASLGALAGLGPGSTKTAADQYVSMLQSVTVSDNIIKRFDLVNVYGAKFHEEARKSLSENVHVSIGKRDGLIRVDAEDVDPKRAAAIANGYVDELSKLTSVLAVTEAQQRRAFFERLLNDTRKRLTSTQTALESSGFSAGALKAEPKAAADNYARLQAELTAAQVRQQVLRESLAETAPELKQQSATVEALREQISRLEVSEGGDKNTADYVGKYRDFKYQERLLDLYSNQYELARIDEAREGALVQVIDVAEPAERKHAPRRLKFALTGGILAALIAAGLLWRRVRLANTTRHGL